MNNQPENAQNPRFTDYPQPSILREFQNSWPLSILGILLVLGGSSLLFWNEGRAIKTSLSLEEGLREIIVPETLNILFEGNNNKLVLVGGPLAIKNSLKEDFYGISINAVKLMKVVQMYQWKEKENTKKHTSVNADGEHVTHVEKTYSYSKDWVDHHIDSATFQRTDGHHNPSKEFWPAESKIETNTLVKIGSFELGPTLKEKFTNYKPVTSDQLPPSNQVKMSNGVYYHSRSVWEPDIGDYRVQFSYAGRQGEEFTVVGKQSGQEIVPYQAETGEELFILHTGLRGAGEVFMTEHYHNRTWTWIYRLAGWFSSFLGLLCVSHLLELVLDLYPTVRNMVTLGVTSLPFSVSITLTLTIIGVGWGWYRPIVGLALLVMGLLPYMVPISRIFLMRGDGQGDHRD
eukprot:GFUD01011230.1.p1 GENE.GFUD01011230.1~~GFUD01011230.1.p1  ORF type:complete len:402 (+),score=104.11 GFUD01011230.1:139-1344(+)